ncbi:MAG: hypothetical protein RJA44_724 [Pseudomonadota bacterium]
MAAAAARSSLVMLDPRLLNCPLLSVEVVTDLAGLDALRDAWETVAALAPRASLYGSFEYVRHAWRHFLQRGEQPYLITVRSQDVLVGLLPLLRVREVHSGVTLRVLRAAGWCGGDHPGLLATLDADLIWEAVFETLGQRHADWDRLELHGLDPAAWPVRHAEQLGRGLRARVDAGAGIAHQPIEGSWTAHLARRSRNTRRAWRRRASQLRRNCADLRVEVARHPADISWAFERYLALEQRSRSHGAAGSAGSSVRSRAFYRELLPVLAERRQAEIWLLYGGGQDIAGLVRLRQRDVVHERHVCFDPYWARYSPGTFLAMQALRMLYGRPAVRAAEVHDLPPEAGQGAIGAWYDAARQTRQLTVTNLRTPRSVLQKCAALLAYPFGVLARRRQQGGSP